MSAQEAASIRRREDGSIDTDFYMEIATRERGLAFRAVFRAIGAACARPLHLVAKAWREEAPVNAGSSAAPSRRGR